MRSKTAAIAAVVALVTSLVGAGAVVFAATRGEESVPLAAPERVTQEESPYPTLEDHCYIEGMIPHHEQALELSELVLASAGVRDRTRALAEFIVSDQSAEIDTMRAWQRAWLKAIPVESAASGGHTSHDAASGTIVAGCGDHGHGEMKGMATPEQLAALAASEGAAADALFLQLMIVHHEGALEMATRAVTEGSNAFVRSSGKHVLVEQEREITAMSGLLDELP